MNEPVFQKIAESLSEFDVHKEQAFIQKIKLVFIELIRSQIQKLRYERNSWSYGNDSQDTEYSGNSYCREFYSASSRCQKGLSILCGPRTAFSKLSNFYKFLSIIIVIVLAVIFGTYYSNSFFEYLPKELYCRTKTKYVPF